MINKYFIGVDIGTQSVKTTLVNETGCVFGEVSVASNVQIFEDGSAFEDCDCILNNCLKSIKDVLNNANINNSDVVAIGIGAQMAGIMAIDENFNAVGPYDSWLDTRCSKYTSMIKEKKYEEFIKVSGGQVFDSHASKILWRKFEKNDEFKIISKFIQPNCYVAGKLANLKADEAFIDYTFLHFNVFTDNSKLEYNEKAFKEFDLDINLMPKIVSPFEIVGNLSKEMAEKLNLSEDVKIIAGCGDTAASSIGAGVTNANMAYDVAGTASVFACATNIYAPDYQNKTILYSRSVEKNLFLPLAYVVGGGLCLEWFSQICDLNFTHMTEEAQKFSKESLDNLFFIPHFNGRAFPLDNNIRGSFIGLRANTTKGEMFRAILESIAFEYRTYLDVLLSSNAINNLNVIYGTGGGAKNSLFCQIKADVLNSKYAALKSVNSGSYALAMMSAKATGFTDKNLCEIFNQNEENMTVYYPNSNLKDYYDTKYQKYKTLVNNYSKYTE